MSDQLHRLIEFGQSIWLDNIRRSMFASGELKRLIDLGLRGMTSNPTIFEKAIGSGTDYDEQLRSLIGSEHDAGNLFWSLAVHDIQSACDEFRPLYDRTGGGDGFVSLEVSPLLAHDTDGTIAAAKELWKRVDRPNVMIKIPGTREGVPAIRAAIGAGINVNVTLLFAPDRYEAAATAFIEGIEDRVKRGEPVDRIASVASVFISRIDSAVDKLLDARIAKGENLEHLLGKAGIANTKLTYERYLHLFESDRFKALAAKGAKPQRPLWASTSAKNPKYPDLMYVENLVGRNTVNTVPPATLDALLDHGVPRPDTISNELDGAKAEIAALAKAQISLFDVTEQLTVEGVKSFSDSFDAMLEAIAYKQSALQHNTHQRVVISLDGAQNVADAALKNLVDDAFLKKLWQKDPSPWSSEPQHVAIVKNALGWVEIPETLHEHASELLSFAKQCKDFKHVAVLGMGGSSLAPDVLRATFGQVAGAPQLHVLDSTDPVYVKALEDQLDLAHTLFIVSSKSGTTTEPDVFFRYFYEKVQKAIGAAGAPSHFIAITDPGTKLEQEAKSTGFLRVFAGTPDIGGRYSALSNFGMVPSAVAGYDISAICDRALGAMHANSQSSDVATASGTIFGATIGGLAKAGRDKLTIVTHPKVAAFGAWAEQLIAESTGKSGTGIVPVEDEPVGEPSVYGGDRVFAYVGADLPGADATVEARLKALAEAGHPVIRLQMSDELDIGEQFYTWEIATAAAGSILGIDAFDQPNVQESKDNTTRLIAEFTREGKFTESTPAQTHDGISVYPLKGSSSFSIGNDLTSAIAALFGQIQPGDYVATNAYIPMTPQHQSFLRTLRTKIRDTYKVATTVGFGPRFLHSTGQLHKGGPATGVFLQLTYDAPFDLAIPGYKVGFRSLIRAQALGDFESLDKRGRRGLRIHFGGELQKGLEALAAAVGDAVAAKA